MSFDVTDSVLAKILARLDMVVFERLPNGVFVRVGSTPPPAWFSGVFQDLSPDGPLTIAQLFPFLEHFLAEAEDWWRHPSAQRLRSDPFTMAVASGDDISLAASAVVAENRYFLVIESPSDLEERRLALQRAREHALAHEEHVRRTGELRAPIEAAAQIVKALSSSGLTATQEQLALGIGEQLASLAASIESLAPLPKGVYRRPRH